MNDFVPFSLILSYKFVRIRRFKTFINVNRSDMQTEFRIDLRKRVFSLLLFTLFSFTAAFAQVLVRGTVLDEAGETVIGASVMIKGTTQGTITDFDGKF